MEFIDLTKKIDVIEDVIRKREESKDKLSKGQRVEFEVMDSIQVDNYSFAFIKTKNGRKGYEIIIKKDGEEYHFIVAEENNGFIPVLNVIKKISDDGDKKIVTMESYYMKENQLIKVASGTYEIQGKSSGSDINKL